MTLVVLLLGGLGFVLVLSAIETDPATGKSTSVVKTIGDVWNDRLDFSQPSSGGKNQDTIVSGAGPGYGYQGYRPVALSGSAATAAYLASHRGL